MRIGIFFNRTPSAMLVGALALSPFSVGAWSQSGKEPAIKLAKPDGKEVVVPLSGPLSNDSAQGVAKDIQSFDKQVKSKKYLAHVKNPEVAEAMAEIAAQSRNDALEQLDLAYRIAGKTSGELDNRLIDGAKHDINAATQVLSSPPPPSVNVRTQISTTVPNAALHYCRVDDFKENGNSCGWESYSLVTM